MRIEALRQEILGDIGRANEPFALIGRIVPALKDGVWSYTEELFEKPVMKLYPPEEADWAAYLADPSRAAFLAYEEDRCIGQIVLRSDWNKYAFIEDLCVAAAVRRRGTGRALMDRAEQWAREKGLCGLALETQDNNLSACRFYAACGFAIGAVNTMLYRNFDKPYCEETAVFWYKRFGGEEQ